MGLPNVGEKTLVFQVVDGCMCNGCVKKVRKNLQQIHGTISIDYNEGEGKLTIQGKNLDSKMVITKLGEMNKNVEFVTQKSSIADQIEKKQIALNGMEDFMVVVDNSLLDQNEGEEKLTIQGKNLDSKMVITELGDMKKNVAVNGMEDFMVVVDNPLLDHNEMEQIASSEMEILNDGISTMVLKRSQSHKEVGLSAISMPSHLNHEHELELKQYDKRFTCDGCKEEGYRTRYRCKHCDYELHEDCKNPKLTVSHDLFGESVFKFIREKPICSIHCRVHTESCEACGNEIHGYSYHCEDKNLFLHPMCVKFTGKLCIQGETFILKNKATPKCFWCNGSENKANSGWSYVSENDKGQVHVNCMAKMAHETWKGKAIEGSDDAYILVLNKRLNHGIVKNTKKNVWSKGGKLLKMIMVFARTIIGILLGDPTVILASTLVEIFKK